ncbi:EamA family transporter RarD [Simiduia agarivorans]|uniref:Membrane protein RarD n=1 Tax=Simiduia agarivorans (strain DSM 21679 / JCM 13881 / BCRC 17597 / SA1) TaxID=1117647 RepID=K4KZX7_SIMAS|nr:EamA family transporter RarD [Simiduia agarivorans]AFU99482.1 membrane protein RarD [Simiduia agarivorans SA1 = DSM 21679]
MEFSREQKLGVLLAMGAFFLWGIFPVYLKAVAILPPLELVAHRIVWSWLFVLAMILVLKQLPKLKAHARNPRMMLALTASTLLLAFNWYLFVYAVNTNRVLEASLAYYINPLLNMALGGIFLSERLRPLQWLAVTLAVTGVAVEIAVFGSVPWLALGMAASFALYGLIRKLAPIDSLNGMMIETSMMLIPAGLYIALWGEATFNLLTEEHWALLALFGPISAVPLMMFASAARKIQYTTLGFLQYIGPTLMFLLAVWVYHEPFGQAKMVTFGFIWAGVACFSAYALLRRR